MDVIKEELKDSVYTIMLNRPDRKNALNTELLIAFHRALQNVRDKGISIVVIRGSGKAFCAGGDIGEFREIAYSGASMDVGADLLHKSILLIRKIDAIVIAVLEGVVVGAGIGISLASDLSVASKNTIMNMGYRRIGFTPDGGCSMFLPGIIGLKRFNELYLSSRNMDMEEAKALGLVNFVWDEGEFEEQLRNMIKDLKNCPMEPIDYFKDLVNQSLFPRLEAHLDREKAYFTKLGKSPGFKERLDSFVGKK